LETKKSQMNINFFRLFIKCFWWLLKQETWKEKKIINISVGIYVHHKKTTHQEKTKQTNKQTNYTSSNQE